MLLKNHSLIETNNISNFPIVSSYCYLGIIIDNKGSVKNHLNALKNRINKLCSKLRSIVYEMTL